MKNLLATIGPFVVLTKGYAFYRENSEIKRERSSAVYRRLKQSRLSKNILEQPVA